MPKPDQERTDRMKRIGELLFGDRFGAKLYRALGIPQGTMAQLLLGPEKGRKVTTEIETKMADLLDKQASEFIERARKASYEATALRLELGILRPGVSLGPGVPVVEGHAAPEPAPEPEEENDPDRDIAPGMRP